MTVLLPKWNSLNAKKDFLDILQSIEIFEVFYQVLSEKIHLRNRYKHKKWKKDYVTLNISEAEWIYIPMFNTS